ncbi:hypothetical protein SAY87_000260 [Trapa incisa]|uniref:Uncharacterized protein n=1 Tax=Trapa incisa TaxID=236973 RepID=A0AAN7GRE2_9MYRT|nr:hypothetical protein SAY87_000260 [Trapa incisa]
MGYTGPRWADRIGPNMSVVSRAKGTKLRANLSRPVGASEVFPLLALPSQVLYLRSRALGIGERGLHAVGIAFNEESLSPCRHTPFQIIHILGSFLRIWSIYLMYNYLTQPRASMVLVPASLILLLLRKPWKGRPLSVTQVKRKPPFLHDRLLLTQSLFYDLLVTFYNQLCYKCFILRFVGKGTESMRTTLVSLDNLLISGRGYVRWS